MTQREEEKKIQEITDKIVKKYHPEKIILFGSYAWGKPNKDSDVDFFIIKETENTREVAQDIRRSFFSFLFPFDLVIYTPEQFSKWKKLREPFLKKIIDQGKLLYER